MNVFKFKHKLTPEVSAMLAAPELYAMVGKLMRVIEAGIPDLEDVDEYQMAVALLAKIDGGAV